MFDLAEFKAEEARAEEAAKQLQEKHKDRPYVGSPNA